MRLVIQGIVSFALFSIMGCGAHLASNQEPDTDIFESFPSYKIVRAINKKIEAKVPIGSGTQQQIVTAEITGDDIDYELNTLKTTTRWSIRKESEKIITELNTVTELTTPEIDHFTFEVDEQLISAIDGTPLRYNVDLSKLGPEIPADIVDTMNQVQPQWITQEYHLDEIGTLIESGYKIRPNVIRRELLEEFFGEDFSSKIDNFEIVEGYSSYDDKDVVVAGYEVSKNFVDEDAKIEIKGKGYNLYEQESFIHLSGNILILINIEDNLGKKIAMKLNIKQMSTDYEVNGLIGAN